MVDPEEDLLCAVEADEVVRLDDALRIVEDREGVVGLAARGLLGDLWLVWKGVDELLSGFR